MVGADGVAFGVECQKCYATGPTGYNGDDHAMFTPQEIAERWNAAFHAGEPLPAPLNYSEFPNS